MRALTVESIRRLALLYLTSIVILFQINIVNAHNKVVVIPLSGDETQEQEPTSPVAIVDPEQTDYTIMTDTVIDNTTGLEWQRADDDILRNWNESFDHCAGLQLDGHNDWRMPDIIELQSIVDYGQSTSPTIEGVAFTGTNSASYFSSSSTALGSGFVLSLNFAFGFINIDGRSSNILVRCVRQ